jgi:excisionase family DNA binding protein
MDAPRLASDKLAYSVAEASAALGLGVTNVRREVKAGRIKAVRIGKKILLARSELEHWLKERSREPASSCSVKAAPL